MTRSLPAVIKRWRSISNDDGVFAPSLIRIECTTAFTRLAHTRTIKEPDARDLVRRLLRFPIRIVEQDALYPRAFDIARSLGKSKAYDALYLAAAEYESAELLTVDGGMHDAARRLGIRVSLVG